jgi:hypothetical protein
MKSTHPAFFASLLKRAERRQTLLHLLCGQYALLQRTQDKGIKKLYLTLTDISPCFRLS